MANVPASVRQRLLNLARAQQRPFQEVLQFYVMERFLYRLSRSHYADRFVLKGALMLQVWDAPQSRPTMDIDMLGHITNAPDTLLNAMRDVLAVEVPEDGLRFAPESLRAESITEDADYQGVRIRGQATLDGAQVRLQLDIGFGDVVLPEPKRMRYPALLDFPTPELLCYSRESTIAEKLQAMVALGALNSRMKDFYDIWLLSRQFDFDLTTLVQAIAATFNRRRTPLPGRALFGDHFAADKAQQWQAFLRRLGDDMAAEPDFARVLSMVQQFAGDAIVLSESGSEKCYWPVGGPWRPVEIGK
jgi:predicted nucleotidyltransferase component of viral defense system